MVTAINITTPSTLLSGDIELVDTPGLDDTERFRVSLTEQSVEDVDAILFLTKSGVAYGQSEKDFLLSLLRKGTIKQLIIVITQVDQTYEQHVKAAQADDDEPKPIAERIAMEKRRIKDEIRKTLEELSVSDSSTTKAYTDQFSNVDIVFTSVMAHRDHQANKTPGVTIAANDPGGLINFKSRLNVVLSTESRTSVTANLILNQSKGALESLADLISSKINAIKNIQNRDEVERRLNNFRLQFAEICKGVEIELGEIYETFKESTEHRLDMHKNNIENIVLKAGKELNKFKTQDVGRHWKSRRSGYWGYMYDLQASVANRIFPTVKEMLESHIEDFSTYISRHELKISKLSKDAVKSAIELELAEFTNFDIKERLKESSNNFLKTTEDQINAEQEQIIKLLDTFITEEVESKISDAKNSVSDIWGKGTTNAQQSEVIAFYDTIEDILSKALTEHITNRNSNFAKNLLKAAHHAPRETFHEVDAQLESSLENLRQATEMALNGQQESAEKILLEISQKSKSTVSSFSALIESLTSSPESGVDEHADIPQELSSQAADESNDWADELLNSCKTLFNSHSLKEGQTSWSYSRIFDPAIFNGSDKIRIIEPYLFKPYQHRNLQELLLLILETAKPKLIEVFTLPTPIEWQEHNSKFFDNLIKEIFSSNGVILDIKIKPQLHDRYIFSNSGFVAKLGRGLDIYKPSTGLAAHRQDSRKVRACEISIFTTLSK